MGDLSIKYVAINKLIPYANNSRTHDDAQVAQIAASIKEFGFTNPILIDKDDSIIAGHGRVLAARKLNLETVPTIKLEGLTETQKRAYIIADNKLALNAGWDNDLLMLELDALKDADYDLDLTGFSAQDLTELNNQASNLLITNENDAYTYKIEAPIYKITGENPDLYSLIDRNKTKELIAEIESAKLPIEVSDFLIFAAERHTVFNFRNIAEYYAHSDEKTQTLMEKSALIIIDFNQAIEQGYVKLTKSVAAEYECDAADE